MQRAGQTEFRIGAVRVQPTLGALTVNDRAIHVEPRLMSLLVCLAERAGEVVAKETLLDIVWPDTFVTEQVLKVAVSELRKVLGDAAREPRFIQTVPKQGYRLIAPVTYPGAEPEAPLPPPPTVVDRRAAPKKRRRWLAITGAVGVVLVAAFLAWKIMWTKPDAARRQPIRAIAVLPLKNMSGDAAEEYFADGLTEALIADFARTTRLKVISRTSVMRYKDAAKTIPQIAAELQVDAVVEGSVLRSGDRVRVIVQLIDGATDRHLWAQKYERESKDILLLQGDVAATAARQMEAQLLPTAVPPVDLNPDAYDACLKGRSFWNQGGKENLLRSAGYFEQAVQLDPNFAPGLAGLADAHNFLALSGFGETEEHYDKAREAARRAVALAPDLAETHAALAFNLMYADWNWAEAESEFRRALDLEPGRAVTHHWAASLYSLLGRHDEAIAEARQAHALDPLSVKVNGDLAWYYYYARRFEEAIRLCRRTLELDPSASSMGVCLQLCYQFTDQPENAVAELEKALARERRPAAEIEACRRAFAQGGWRRVWRQRVQTLELLAKTEPPRFYPLVLGHAFQGETEKAIFWIARAFEKRAGWMPFAGTDPGFDGLRGDPRFQALLRRLGVPG